MRAEFERSEAGTALSIRTPGLLLPRLRSSTINPQPATDFQPHHHFERHLGEGSGEGLNMKLPTEYVPHLDHRITVLMAFTVRRDCGWFDCNRAEQKNFGDLYRASLEGAGIMLRMLMEFLGVKAARNNRTKSVEAKHPQAARLGKGKLRRILKVDINSRTTFRK